MKLKKSPRLQSGISMVEIMIALLIGIFLTSGLIQMFITTRATNKLQDAVSRLQENGRFAIEFISQDVRMADYFVECYTAVHDPSALMGTDNDAVANNGIIDGTDTITVRQTTGPCDNRTLIATTYFINTGANGRPSLFKTVVQTTQLGTPSAATTTTTNEQIEGIEDLQILYGVDTDAPIATDATVEVFGTPNYYVSANLVQSSDWDNVVSVQVSLLAGTVDDNIASQPVPFTYLGVTTTPTDTRIRRVYNTTITVRNRLS